MQHKIQKQKLKQACTECLYDHMSSEVWLRNLGFLMLSRFHFQFSFCGENGFAVKIISIHTFTLNATKLLNQKVFSKDNLPKIKVLLSLNHPRVKISVVCFTEESGLINYFYFCANSPFKVYIFLF